MSLKYKIRIIFLIIAILPLIGSSIISIVQTRNSLIAFGNAQLQLASSEVAKSIYEILDAWETIAMSHSRDGRLRDYISNEGSDTNLDNLRRSYLFSQELILTTMSGSVISYTVAPGIIPSYSLGQNINNTDEIRFSSLTKATSLVLLKRDTAIFSSYLLKNDDITGGGYLIEIFSTDILKKLLNSSTTDIGFPILKRNNGETILGITYNNSYIVHTAPINVRGLYIEFVQKESIFLKPVYEQIYSNLILSGILLILVIIISFWATMFIIGPINLLLESFKSFRETKRLKSIVIKNKDEFGKLVEEFNLIVNKIVSADELAARTKTLEAVMYVLVHDTRGSLDDMTFGLDLLKELLPENQIIELGLLDIINLITQGLTKQTIILNGLREWLRAGKQIDNPISVDLNELMCEILHTNYFPGEVIAKSLPIILGNRDLLFNVFLNLITNGLKYNDKPLSTVTIYSIDNSVIVEDNGTGIQEELLERLFQPFQRGDYKKEGSGLGLAITKSIIDAHNFSLEVKTEINVGTKFVITIPTIYIVEG